MRKIFFLLIAFLFCISTINAQRYGAGTIYNKGAVTDVVPDTTRGSLFQYHVPSSQMYRWDIDLNQWVTWHEDKDRFIVNQASHGFSLGDVVSFDKNGVFFIANLDVDSLHYGVVADSLDQDNFEIIFNGVLNWDSHGYLVGYPYFMQSNGSLDTIAADLSDYVFWVIDNNHVYVVDQRAATGSVDLGGGSLTADYGNILYVSKTSGDSATAEIGNPFKPFADPWNAKYNASAGDLVYIIDGFWQIGVDVTLPINNYDSTSLIKNGVDFFWAKNTGIGINSTSDIRLFADTSGAKATHAGYLKFIAGRTNARTLYIDHPNAQIELNFDSLSLGDGSGFNTFSRLNQFRNLDININQLASRRSENFTMGPGVGDTISNASLNINIRYADIQQSAVGFHLVREDGGLWQNVDVNVFAKNYNCNFEYYEIDFDDRANETWNDCNIHFQFENINIHSPDFFGSFVRNPGLGGKGGNNSIIMEFNQCRIDNSVENILLMDKIDFDGGTDSLHFVWKNSNIQAATSPITMGADNNVTTNAMYGLDNVTIVTETGPALRLQNSLGLKIYIANSLLMTGADTTVVVTSGNSYASFYNTQLIRNYTQETVTGPAIAGVIDSLTVSGLFTNTTELDSDITFGRHHEYGLQDTLYSDGTNLVHLNSNGEQDTVILGLLSDGNGIISALPAGDVAIDADTNGLTISNLGVVNATFGTVDSLLRFGDYENGLGFKHKHTQFGDIRSFNGLEDIGSEIYMPTMSQIFFPSERGIVLQNGYTSFSISDNHSPNNHIFSYTTGNKQMLMRSDSGQVLITGEIIDLGEAGDSLSMFGKYYYPDATPTSDGNDYVIAWNNGTPSFTQLTGGGADGNGIYTGSGLLSQDTTIVTADFTTTGDNKKFVIGNMLDLSDPYNDQSDGLFMFGGRKGMVSNSDLDSTYAILQVRDEFGTYGYAGIEMHNNSSGSYGRLIASYISATLEAYNGATSNSTGFSALGTIDAARITANSYIEIRDNFGGTPNVYRLPTTSTPTANQIIHWPTPTTPAFVDVNTLVNTIYTADDNLTGNRIVAANGHNLRFQNIGGIFQVINNAGGSGLKSQLLVTNSLAAKLEQTDSLTGNFARIELDANATSKFATQGVQLNIESDNVVFLNSTGSYIEVQNDTLFIIDVPTIEHIDEEGVTYKMLRADATVLNRDLIGQLEWFGNDPNGGDTVTVSRIKTVASQDWAADDLPVRMEFWIAEDGNDFMTNVMNLNELGQIRMLGNLRLDQGLLDKDQDNGNATQILTSTGTQTDWSDVDTLVTGNFNSHLSTATPATMTPLNNDIIYIDMNSDAGALGGTTTRNIDPTNLIAGAKVWLKVLDADVNTFTLDSTTGSFIEGDPATPSATVLFNQQRTDVMLVWDGTNWLVWD